MLLVVPVSHKDIVLAEKQAGFIHQLGGLNPERHKVAIIGSRSLGGKLAPLEAAWTKILGEENVQTSILKSENEAGWPQSANHAFEGAVEWVAQQRGKTPWYFFEVDNTPLTADWLDQIEDEYHLVKRPYLGYVHPTRRVSVKTGEFVDHYGDHMVGTGVYPHDFASRSVLWKFFTDVPFDVYLQWEIVPHCHPTKLIAHNWKSHQYEWTADGRIVCSSITKDSITDPIPDEAVVLHGCKDDSLMACILNPPDGGESPRGEATRPLRRKRKKSAQ